MDIAILRAPGKGLRWDFVVAACFIESAGSRDVCWLAGVSLDGRLAGSYIRGSG